MNSLSLTSAQQVIATDMHNYAISHLNNQEYFTLTGGPGTGKTYTTAKVLNDLKHYSIAAVAPSHAAVNVLASYLPVTIKVYTLAAILGRVPGRDKTGNVIFVLNKQAFIPMKLYDIILLDEASMVDDATFTILVDIAKEYGIKLIAIGDKYQLPPVEQEHDSQFFDNIHGELFESLRFKGPIDILSKTFKQELININKEEYFDKYILNSFTQREDNYDETLKSGYRFKSNVQEILEQAAEDFKENPNNINYSRILAFKNVSVDILNREIRKLIYGQNTEQFETNEIIIANNTIYPTFNGKINIHTPLIYNGLILEIESFIEDIGPGGIPCLLLKFVGRTISTPIRVVRTDDNGEAMDKYNKIKNELKMKALKDNKQWAIFKLFENNYLQYNYAYALNLYRAQGSTLKNVYILDGEVMKVKPLTWKQKFQALYVAMTRPTHNLTFYSK